MSLQVYINGKLVPQAEATVSVFDHGLLYGDGVFEGLRSYGGKVFRLEAHVQRLYESAQAIWLTIPMSQAEMSRAKQHLDNVRAILKFAKPHSICVYCEGKANKCTACNGTGWITQPVFDMAPKEKKN